MNETIDVRERELVDASRLGAWLQSLGVLGAGESLTVRQFPAGFSNLTYLVTVGEPSRALVLRRPPRGVRGGVAHDMSREYGILAALHPLGVPVPRPLALCADDEVLGAPFYVMERVDGVILRGNRPPELSPDADERRVQLARLSRVFVDTLAGLHSAPIADARLASLGRPDGYVMRQVRGWTERWERSRTEPNDELDAVAEWLAANAPADSPSPALIHNDFKFDNLVLSPELTGVRAILDWEMATVGDPLMDLGTSLAYWIEADDPPVFRSLGLGVTALPGSMTRAELVRAYMSATGREIARLAFYEAYGVFKVAIIAQQIYARHARGLTADPRFGALGPVVRALGTRAFALTS